MNLMYEEKFTRNIYLAMLVPPIPQNTLDLHKPILVKFAKTYCEEFHNYMAKQGLAPKLYCCQRITNYEKYLFLIVNLNTQHADPITW
jgi:hypothetical protein